MKEIQQYEKSHQNKLNLIFHIISVPVFIITTLLLCFYLVQADFLKSLVMLILSVSAIAIQAIGHKLEECKPEPFSGPANAIIRIFIEQFYKFWIFLFYKALRRF